MTTPAGAPVTHPDATTDAALVMARCDQLAAISAEPDRLERVYLSKEHARANSLVARWMREAGMRAWQDAAGNQCGRLEGAWPGLPALVLGSHLDTVPDAGRYDGMLGVVMALAVVRRLRERASRLPFAVEVYGFGDEEGTRFGAALLGSRAMAGTWDQAWWDLTDERGTSLYEAFLRFGLEPERVGAAARRKDQVVGYLEAHIEQGPYLEAGGRALGVVSSIAGARRFQLRIVGEARHAGGTPYPRRRDALCGAADAVLQIERIARSGGYIATVGQLEAFPGGVNVIPGRADFSLDLRAEFDADRDQAWAQMRAAIEATCAARGLTLHVTETHRAPAVRCGRHLLTAVANGIHATGDPAPMSLFSKAGHDGMAVATLTDIGMLFLRCHDGISHHADESVLAADVAAGLDAFEAAVLAVAAQPGPVG